eukprot:Rhum_TRINITY_DN7610_c0_g1::Rhum_TRINITY_DN7610_c0_g1_i1::g.23783::m.23783
MRGKGGSAGLKPQRSAHAACFLCVGLVILLDHLAQVQNAVHLEVIQLFDTLIGSSRGSNPLGLIINSSLQHLLHQLSLACARQVQVHVLVAAESILQVGQLVLLVLRGDGEEAAHHRLHQNLLHVVLHRPVREIRLRHLLVGLQSVRGQRKLLSVDPRNLQHHGVRGRHLLLTRKVVVRLLVRLHCLVKVLCLGVEVAQLPLQLRRLRELALVAQHVGGGREAQHGVLALHPLEAAARLGEVLGRLVDVVAVVVAVAAAHEGGAGALPLLGHLELVGGLAEKLGCFLVLVPEERPLLQAALRLRKEFLSLRGHCVLFALLSSQ